MPGAIISALQVESQVFHGSLTLLCVLPAETLTAFVLDDLFQYVCLEKQLWEIKKIDQCLPPEQGADLLSNMISITSLSEAKDKHAAAHPEGFRLSKLRVLQHSHCVRAGVAWPSLCPPVGTGAQENALLWLLLLLQVRKSLVSDPGVSCLLPASVKLTVAG